MEMLIDENGHAVPHYQPLPGIYIPLRMNASWFGGKQDETVEITPEKAKELAQYWFDLINKREL